MKQSAAIAPSQADGRKDIAELYSVYHSLAADGWIAETVAVSARRNSVQPILSFRTQKSGPALWIISGIHGEEPAGPNALAAAIGVIRDIGKHMPVVLLPLCNPLGYEAGWRYLDRPAWQEGVNACSVGDAEHVLPQAQGNEPRAAAASSPEAAALVAHVLEHAPAYPPAVTLDFHEDNLLEGGYIYSQGRFGPDDVLAHGAVEALASTGMALRRSGKTRFGEDIVNGVVGPQADGSIDELLAAQHIIINNARAPGPAAETTLVIETPAALPLEKRIAAHMAVLANLREVVTG